MSGTVLSRFVIDCRRAAKPEIPIDRHIALAGLVETPFFNANDYGVVRARAMAAVRTLALAAESARGAPVADRLCQQIGELGEVIASLDDAPAAAPDVENIPYRPGVDQ